MVVTQQGFLQSVSIPQDRGAPIRIRGEVGCLSITGQTFQYPIDLSGARFTAEVRFNQCTFDSSITFLGASFERGAAFVDCTFRGPVLFTWAVFSGLCYFWRSEFIEYADFSKCVVQPLETGVVGPSPFLQPAETNFSWAHFRSGVTFYRMQCAGPAWFWRTVVRGDSSFDEAKFGGAVKFYGAEDQVNLARRDLQHPALFDHLLSREVLVKDHEGRDYAQFAAIKSRGDLESRLRDCGVDPQTAETLCSIWAGRAIPTFADDTSFQSVTLGQPEKCEFAEIDLSRCLFRGTDIGDANFSSVKWARAAVFPIWTRSAVRDELVARAGCEEVGLLYSQLEANSARNGRYGEASDFRYGKMEMLRKDQPAYIRGASVLAIYKYLSGYGERYGLALGWLGFFVVILFPALYLALGLEAGAGGALLHSLEISTFLEPTGTSTAETGIRFVEGIERLLAPLQAGLFILAVNRRLGKA